MVDLASEALNQFVKNKTETSVSPDSFCICLSVFRGTRIGVERTFGCSGDVRAKIEVLESYLCPAN